MKTTHATTCPRCDGAGDTICPNCNGNGSRYPERPNSAICRECRGRGVLVCGECEGAGEINATGGTTDFSTPESIAESELMRRYVEHAPQNPGTLADGLCGWWLPAGNWLCARCAGRIFARGCQLPRNAEPVFENQAIPRGVCCCCEG